MIVSLESNKNGVLADISSLPGAYGMGEIGPHAVKFLHLLQETGQTLWQVNSLHTSANERLFTGTSYGGNIQLISFAWLREDGLVFEEELQEFRGKILKNPECTTKLRYEFLLEIARKFYKRASFSLLLDLVKFCKAESCWLDDFALFQALNLIFDGKPWFEWPEKLMKFERNAIVSVKNQLRKEIEEFKILQFLFYRYWRRIKEVAQTLGVQIGSTFTVSVAYNSFEAWSNQNLFFLDGNCQMTANTAIYPCKFLPNGKILNGPQYRWNRIKDSDYQYWNNRFKQERLFADAICIEHFSTMFESLELPVNGDVLSDSRLVPAGNFKIIEHLLESFGPLNVIAIDIFAKSVKADEVVSKLQLGKAQLMFHHFDDIGKSVNNGIFYSSTCLTDSLKLRSNKDKFTDLDNNMESLKCLMKLRSEVLVVTFPDLMELDITSDSFLNWRFSWDDITDVLKKRLAELAAF